MALAILLASVPATPALAAGKAGRGGGLAVAEKAAKKLLVRPSSLRIPSLPRKPIPGKTVDIIACNLPSCQSYVPMARAALETVGWKLVKITTALTPQAVDAAYEQAVRNKPAGVIGTGGITPSVFAHPLAQLKSEGVPVALQLISPTTVPGVTGIILNKKNMAQYGTDLADYILWTSGGKDAHVVLVYTPATPVYENSQPTFKSTLLKNCKTCSVSRFSIPVTGVGTTVPAQIVSYLRTHPSINYVDLTWSTMADGVPAALLAAGLATRVRLVGQGISQTTVSYMKAGQFLATIDDTWFVAIWDEVNMILRYNMKLSVKPAEEVKLPTMITTRRNLIQTSPGQTYFPVVAKYQQAFKKAWHVTSRP
jgi:ribose transport system substrate-binding protein